MRFIRMPWIGVLIAVFVAIPLGARQGAAQEPRDITYGGDIEGGGTVQITLTPDSTAVTRVALFGARFMVVAPDLPTRSVVVSRDLYFVPPVVFSDGVDVTLPIDIDREARSSVHVVGTLADDGFSGTATYRSCVFGVGCSDITTTTWTASERVAMPPGPDDRIFSGSIEGGGAIRIALSADAEDATWVSIRDLPAEACLPGDPPFAIDVFFDPPAPLDAFGVPLLQTTSNLQILALSASRSDATLDGHVVLNTFRSDCNVTRRWSATEVNPPTSTISSRPSARSPTATPPTAALPNAGSGPRSATALWLWLAALAALLGCSALAIARPR